jgi:hypothetical protein
VGFSLAETCELLALRARKGAPCAAVREKAEQKLAIIEQKLAELAELRDAVRALIGACHGNRAVEHCTILAALSGEDQPSRERNRIMAATTSTSTSSTSCFACVEACEKCIENCLKTDAAAQTACIRACRDCIDACVLAARLEARSSPLAEEARKLCRLARSRHARPRRVAASFIPDVRSRGTPTSDSAPGCRVTCALNDRYGPTYEPAHGGEERCVHTMRSSDDQIC